MATRMLACMLAVPSPDGDNAETAEANLGLLQFDPTAPLADRDRAIVRIATLLRPTLLRLLKRAGLPLNIPGFDLSPGRAAQDF